MIRARALRAREKLLSKLPVTGELLRGSLLERTIRHTKDCPPNNTAGPDPPYFWRRMWQTPSLRHSSFSTTRPSCWRWGARGNSTRKQAVGTPTRPFETARSHAASLRRPSHGKSSPSRVTRPCTRIRFCSYSYQACQANNWPGQGHYLADPSMSAAGRCGHFN
jgi:hypothetical protein